MCIEGTDVGECMGCFDIELERAFDGGAYSEVADEFSSVCGEL